MPNDAKLGLVLGIGVVVLIGIVFAQADSATTPTANPTDAPPVTSVNSITTASFADALP